MHLAVRGFYGEGTESVGDFFQVSNQTTLGKTEAEILTDFQDNIIPQIIEYEHEARKALAERRSNVLDDKIYRAWGVLTNARMLGGEEAFYLLSHLRLGVSMGRLEGVRMGAINELFLLTQPAHLQKMARQPLGGDERRAYRAAFIRDRLTDTSAETADRQ
jgi:protein arginine kinase